MDLAILHPQGSCGTVRYTHTTRIAAVDRFWVVAVGTIETAPLEKDNAPVPWSIHTTGIDDLVHW
jgi:hypothetical protein